MPKKEKKAVRHRKAKEREENNIHVMIARRHPQTPKR